MGVFLPSILLNRIQMNISSESTSHRNQHPIQHLNQDSLQPTSQSSQTHQTQRHTTSLQQDHSTVEQDHSTVEQDHPTVDPDTKLSANFEMIPKLLTIAGVVVCAASVIRLATGEWNDVAESAIPDWKGLTEPFEAKTFDLALVYAILHECHCALESISPYFGLVFDKCLLFGASTLFGIGYTARYMLNFVTALNNLWVPQLDKKGFAYEGSTYIMKAIYVLFEAFGLQFVVRKTLPVWRTIFTGQNMLVLFAIGVAMLTGWEFYKPQT